MSLKINRFQFNAFQENTFLVWDKNLKCLIFDPGCYSKEEEMEIIDFIEKNKLTPVALLNTHAHIDHVLGNNFILQNFEVDFYLHNDDFKTLQSVDSYAHLYGFEGYKTSPKPTKELKHNQTLHFGEMKIKVFHTPGHSPGHVVFYFEDDCFVINGDVLFKGSFGRVDLPGGDIKTLKNSIFETLFSLPNETVVYCGHGPATTIGEEKKSNYILQF
jgi:glyoxylase-like metal-dependent hydrolase (beta-lactamase superfamily II)